MNRENVYIDGLTLKEFINRTMLLMAVGLGVSTIVAWITVDLFMSLLNNMGRMGAFLPVFIILVELILVSILSKKIMSLTKTQAYGLFLAYAAVNGFSLSYIFNLYTTSSVVLALTITSILFFSMSVIGHTTKIDLTNLKSIFSIGLIFIIISSTICIFINSPFMDWLVTCFGIILFLGLVAYDSQRLRNLYNESYSNPELVNKLAIFGALELYLDFINLFIRILSLFGKRKD